MPTFRDARMSIPARIVSLSIAWRPTRRLTVKSGGHTGRLVQDQPVQAHSLHNLYKLREVHGLVNVTIRAQIVASYEIALFTRRGQDDHRQPPGALVGPDAGQHF